MQSRLLKPWCGLIALNFLLSRLTHSLHPTGRLAPKGRHGCVKWRPRASAMGKKVQGEVGFIPAPLLVPVHCLMPLASLVHLHPTSTLLLGWGEGTLHDQVAACKSEAGKGEYSRKCLPISKTSQVKPYSDDTWDFRYKLLVLVHPVLALKGFQRNQIYAISSLPRTPVFPIFPGYMYPKASGKIHTEEPVLLYHTQYKHARVWDASVFT